jgi:putative ABC transport system permease protein
MVIMIQLDWDYNFDRFHKERDRIYRLDLTLRTIKAAIISRPYAESFFASSPHIVAGAMSRNIFGDGELFFHVENGGELHFFREYTLSVTPEYTEVFTFDFVEGTPEALKAPENVLIPLSLAHKMFGNESAVGKQLMHNNGTQTVGAVYCDFPSNSILNNCIYAPIPREEGLYEWSNFMYVAYIRVNDASNAHTLVENFKRSFDFSLTGFGADLGWEESDVDIHLTALPDIHFATDVQYDSAPKSSRQTLLILFAIALVIVAIAGINFTNFSTALSPLRIKSINTQKVLGSGQFALRSMLVFEALFISMLSFFLAIGLVALFRQTSLALLTDARLSLFEHPYIVGATALVALLTALLAGLFPACYITSFAPAIVLKGNFGLSPKGRKLRNALIGIQFIASFALIIGACFMYLQNHFMQHAPLGYEKDALITVNIERIAKNRDAFANQIKSYSGIEDITFGESLLSSSDGYNMWSRKYRGEDIMYQVIPVHHTFLKVMGIEVTQGRDFRAEDELIPHGAYIYNETARKQYNMELNTMISGWSEGVIASSGEVIGFIPDIKFASFRTTVEPMAFFVWGTDNWGSQPYIAYIKLKPGANVRTAMSHIQSTLTTFEANYTFDVRFFSEVLQRLYEKEGSFSTLISLFSLIAIFISIVGVFGLVVFDSESRRREIGIRKVHGSSTTGILVLFNKAYFNILLICFIMAVPLAWYAVQMWLQNFAYKTPMYWWVYLLTFMAVGIITASTVTFQNWRVANENPVKSIKAS